MAADLIVKRALWLLCALPLLASAAEQLADPTRPPAGILEGAGSGNGGGTAQARMTPSMKGLTSVIMSSGRCAAIIDGRMVKLGELHEGARLVEVTPGTVVLDGGGTVRTLHLFQGVGLKQSGSGEPPVRPAAACKLPATTAPVARKMKISRAPAAGGQEEKK